MSTLPRSTVQCLVDVLRASLGTSNAPTPTAVTPLPTPVKTPTADTGFASPQPPVSDVRSKWIVKSSTALTPGNAATTPIAAAVTSTPTSAVATLKAVIAQVVNTSDTSASIQSEVKHWLRWPLLLTVMPNSPFPLCACVPRRMTL